MTIPELLAKLTKLYPLGGTEAWADEYRRLLKPFAGPSLDKAWDATMAGWDKGFPPRPADIRKHCRYEHKSGSERHVEGRDGWAQVERRTDELVDDWFRDHPEIGERANREGWMMLLRDQIRTVAFSAAQQQALGKQDYIGAALQRLNRTDWLTPEEADSMRDRVQAWARGPSLQSKSGPKSVTQLIGGEWRRTA